LKVLKVNTDLLKDVKREKKRPRRRRGGQQQGEFVQGQFGPGQFVPQGQFVQPGQFVQGQFVPQGSQFIPQGPGVPRTQAPRAPRAPQTIENQQNPTGATGDAPAKRKRKPRTRKLVDPANPAATPPPAIKREKVMSTTTLFVANLPFSVDDEALAKVFEGCKSAHIVKTRSNRSRGYGFVVFENEEQQLKALETKNGTLVPSPVGDPRAIVLSISSSVASSPEGTSVPAETTN